MSLDFELGTRRSLAVELLVRMVSEMTTVFDEAVPWTRRRAVLEKWWSVLRGAGIIGEAEERRLGWSPEKPLDPETLRRVAHYMMYVVGSRVFAARAATGTTLRPDYSSGPRRTQL